MFDYDHYGSAFVDMRLHQLRVLITEQCDDLFLDHGISTPSAAVSVVLFLQKKGHGSIAQIADALGYSHQLINHRLSQLEALGFTQRFHDVRDRRKWLIKLTAKGRAEAKKIDAILPIIANAFDSIFDAAGIDLTATLKDVHQMLSTEPLSTRTQKRGRRRLA